MEQRHRNPERQILILKVFLKGILESVSLGGFMTRRVFALLLSFLFVALTLSAHGDKKHVIGTIERLSSGSVTVKTRDGKSVQVKLVPTTAYVARVATADKPATLSDLAVGENVVIHATPKGDDLEADEVRFSIAGASPSASSKTQPHP